MPNATCTRNCWITAAGLGLLVWIFTAGFGPLRWFEGLFLGVVALAVFGIFLVWLLCRGVPAMDGADWHPETHSTTPEQDQELRPRGVASLATEGFLGSAQGDQAHPVAPSGDAQPPSEPGERSGVERNDIYGAATPKVATNDGGNETPDDLKEIKGVGPKLEEMLHEHGVTRFDQIAAWNDAEIDHYAELIGRMGGRIRSDDWVGQARTLAAGGETEFSKRVEEGGVY